MPGGERRAALRKPDAGDTIMTSTNARPVKRSSACSRAGCPQTGGKDTRPHSRLRGLYPDRSRPLAESNREARASSLGLEGVNLESPEPRAKLQALARRELRAMRTGRRAGVWTRRWLAVPAAGAVLALLFAFVVLPGLRTGPALHTPRGTPGASESVSASSSPRAPPRPSISTGRVFPRSAHTAWISMTRRSNRFTGHRL